MIDFSTTAATGGAVGYYATQTDLEQAKGPTNIAVYSNAENGTTDADNARIQAALDYADRFINDYLAGVGVATPVAGFPQGLTDVAVELAYVYLIDPRVIRMTETPGEGPGRELFFAMREAKQMLSRLAAFNLGAATRLTTADVRPTWNN